MFTSQRISNTFFFSRPGNCHVQEIEISSVDLAIVMYKKLKEVIKFVVLIRKKVLKNSQNLENFSKIFFQLWFPLQCKLI